MAEPSAPKAHRRKNFFPAFGGYVAAAYFGALVFSSQRNPNPEAGPIGVMLIMLTVCMVKERGLWRVWQRVGFVCLAWIGQGCLLPATAIIASPVSGAGAFIYGGTLSTLATLPWVWFGMTRSALFMEPAARDPSLPT